jgi:hypothetical protein
MEVTRQQAQKLMQELDKAVREVFKNNKLELAKQSSTFGESFSYKVQAVAVRKSSSGINLATPEVKLYEKYGYFFIDNCKQVQLKAKIGKKFNFDNRQFIFAGIRGGSGKSQVVCISNGKKYYFTDEIIKVLNKK